MVPCLSTNVGDVLSGWRLRVDGAELEPLTVLRAGLHQATFVGRISGSLHPLPAGHLPELIDRRSMGHRRPLTARNIEEYRDGRGS